MAETKLEQVARAIMAATSTHVHRPYDILTCRIIARAAIEALREPTEAMYEAAILTHVRENKGIEHSPHLSWQAMIDAILKEEGNG